MSQAFILKGRPVVVKPHPDPRDGTGPFPGRQEGSGGEDRSPRLPRSPRLCARRARCVTSPSSEPGLALGLSFPPVALMASSTRRLLQEPDSCMRTGGALGTKAPAARALGEGAGDQTHPGARRTSSCGPAPWSPRRAVPRPPGHPGAAAAPPGRRGTAPQRCPPGHVQSRERSPSHTSLVLVPFPSRSPRPGAVALRISPARRTQDGQRVSRGQNNEKRQPRRRKRRTVLGAHTRGDRRALEATGSFAKEYF